MSDKTAECIFMDRPKECSMCMDFKKLQCLLNKRHLILTEKGKEEIVELARKEANSKERYKILSGQVGRIKGGAENQSCS